MALEQIWRFRGDVGLARGTSAVLKLVVLPALRLGLTSHLVGPDRQDWTAALVLTAAVPTGVNAWLIAQRFRRPATASRPRRSAVTTAFGAISAVGFWAWLLG